MEALALSSCKHWHKWTLILQQHSVIDFVRQGYTLFVLEKTEYKPCPRVRDCKTPTQAADRFYSISMTFSVQRALFFRHLFDFCYQTQIFEVISGILIDWEMEQDSGLYPRLKNDEIEGSSVDEKKPQPDTYVEDICLFVKVRIIYSNDIWLQ